MTTASRLVQRSRLNALTFGGLAVVLGLGLALATDVAGRSVLWANLYWLVAAGYALLVSLSSRTESRHDGRIDRLFSLSFGCYFVGQLVWSVQVLVGADAVPGPSDIFFLASAIPTAVAFVQMTLLRAESFKRRVLLIDAAITVLALAVLIQVLVVPTRGAQVEILIQMLYPILFLAPTGAAIVFVAANPPRPRFTGTLLLVVAWIVLGAAFTVWTMRAVAGDQAPGHPADYAFGAGLVLAGLGAATRRGTDTARSDSGSSDQLRSDLIPVVASVGGVAVALLGGSRAHSPAALALTSISLVALSGFRQVSKLSTERRYERNLAGMIQEMPVMIFAEDHQGRVQTWNRECERVTGFSARDLLNGPPPFARTHPAGRTDEGLGRTVVTDSGETVVEFRHRDGSPRFALWTDMQSRFAFPFWAAWAVGVNVTERIEAEASRRVLEGQLLFSQKLEAVGLLAGGIAHHFNNLMTVIRGNVDLMADGRDSPEVRDIIVSIDRSAALVRQLLTFSRRQPASPEVLDLGALVRELSQLLGELIGEDLTLQLEGVDDVHWVRIDRNEFEHVLVSLVVNARDAMPEGGSLTVSITSERNAPRGEVKLGVVDTGIGMSEEAQRHLFEPFYTTKGETEGTGLGLATTYMVVRRWGGSIEVESREGVGSRFSITLPEVDPPMIETRTNEISPGDAGTGARSGVGVLIAEDEERILNLIQRILSNAGHRVLAASSPRAALQLAERNLEQIDLLITDMVMPGMTGFELAEKVVAMKKGIPVIYCSGYFESQVDDAEEGPPGEHLAKPFNPADLLESIRRVLGTAD